MIIEPIYITQKQLGRKIQRAFGQAVEIAISENWVNVISLQSNNLEITFKATFFMPDGSEIVYMEEYNEIWHYPVNGDPVWYVVNRPYAPGDTL